MRLPATTRRDVAVPLRTFVDFIGKLASFARSPDHRASRRRGMTGDVVDRDQGRRMPDAEGHGAEAQRR
jgi:hypothetical protein